MTKEKNLDGGTFRRTCSCSGMDEDRHLPSSAATHTWPDGRYGKRGDTSDHPTASEREEGRHISVIQMPLLSTRMPTLAFMPFAMDGPQSSTPGHDNLRRGNRMRRSHIRSCSHHIRHRQALPRPRLI